MLLVQLSLLDYPIIFWNNSKKHLRYETSITTSLMFISCAGYCTPRLCFYFSNAKTTVTSVVFFSRQLLVGDGESSVAGQLVGSGQIKAKGKSIKRSRLLSFDAVFISFRRVTVVLSIVISTSLLLITYMICSLSSLTPWSVDVDTL